MVFLFGEKHGRNECRNTVWVILNSTLSDKTSESKQL